MFHFLKLQTHFNTTHKSCPSTIDTHLNDNNLISPRQFGFRLKSSTVTACAMFTDDIIRSMDNGKVTGAVFLDLTKAFETVNHDILLQKLRAVCADDNACIWFSSFLSKRSQVTSYRNVNSELAAIPIGVA
jgi:retron-type reverse transcriptase